ncbi:MAG TPA: glycosyltransferase family 2 protein, partial [Methanomassiliicoccaceae archaeon]|nr:glycosyltransferase family 2 protein [Methanomassiliicoccaceae archaeon]
MIIHCSENGLRITEVPISVRYDVPNGHKQGSLRMGMALLNSVVSTIGYKRPLLLFGIPGFVFFSAGLVMAALTLLDVYLIGTWVLQGLMAGFMIIVGTTLVVSALSLNSLSLMMKARNLAR